MNLTNNNKLKSYLGFAIKSRSIVFGIENIAKAKQIKLVLISNKLTQSGKNKILNLCEKKNLKYINIDEELFDEIIQKAGIKIVAITDKNLSDAIIKELNYFGGNFEQNRK